VADFFVSNKIKEQLYELKKCRQSPEYFIFKYLQTRDEHGEGKEEYKQRHIKSFIKIPFPDYEYLRYVVQTYQENNVIVIMKSRQMMLSWIFCAILLWDTLFKEGRLNLIQCKNADDADEHLKNRVFLMYENLPPWMKQFFQMRYKQYEIYCPRTKSLMKGLPEGGEVIRQKTASNVLMDEMAFQPQARAAFRATMPTVENGGKFIGITTPNGKNFAWELWDGECYDWEELMQGFMVKHNPDGVCAVRLHYSAHPKRDSVWVAKEKPKYLRKDHKLSDWEMEYEINFNVLMGQKVFIDYDPVKHENAKIVADPSQPILRGWDFGQRNPACVFTQLTTNDQFIILGELLGYDLKFWDFIGNVQDYCDEHFPEVIERNGKKAFKDYADTTGNQMRGDAVATFHEILNEFGIYAIHRKTDRWRGIKIMMKLLDPLPDGSPGLLIDPTSAPLMADGFRGAFHYRIDKDGKVHSEEYADDNDCTHLFDAAKYICHNHPKLDRILTAEERVERKPIEDGMSERAFQHRKHFLKGLAARNSYARNKVTRFRRLAEVG
jgi:hypothetical protein